MKKLFNGVAIVCMLLLFFSAKANSTVPTQALDTEVCMKCTGDPNGTFTCVKIKCPIQ